MTKRVDAVEDAVEEEAERRRDCVTAHVRARGQAYPHA